MTRLRSTELSMPSSSMRGLLCRLLSSRTSIKRVRTVIQQVVTQSWADESRDRLIRVGLDCESERDTVTSTQVRRFSMSERLCTTGVTLRVQQCTTTCVYESGGARHSRLENRRAGQEQHCYRLSRARHTLDKRASSELGRAARVRRMTAS